jgi:hypothetical protein
MSDALRDVPEFFEVELRESVQSRTETLCESFPCPGQTRSVLTLPCVAAASFRELGPPDLCHITKSPAAARSATKEVGSYHYVSGVDASSSASLAAYLNVRLSICLSTLRI